MDPMLQDLVGLLELENIEVNLFRGQSRNLGGKSVFGGQVLGQALAAARRTVHTGVAHSLHAYFVRPGDMDAPIVYDVERIRDGRSFIVRRVHAIQHGRPIFSMIASFQDEEPGLEHQQPMPQVPAPEELLTQWQWRQKWIDDCPEKLRESFLRPLPIEIRPVDPVNPFQPEAREPVQHIWFRAPERLPDNPDLHQAVLTYASDFNLLSTAMLPHAVTFFNRNMIVASLDHALWFHRPCRADEWLLYSMSSPVAQGARGLSWAQIYSQDGTLVASAAQESLMRDTRLLASMTDGG